MTIDLTVAKGCVTPYLVSTFTQSAIIELRDTTQTTGIATPATLGAVTRVNLRHYWTALMND